MKTYLYSIILVTLAIFFSCKEELANQPISTGSQPDQITIVSQQEIAGGSEITFKAPQNKDFTYVKAVYTVKPGKEVTITSSLYEDKIVLHGFTKEGSYPVRFYAVSKGEVLSDPLVVNVNVAKPSFRDVFDNLHVFDDFSGFTVTFDNPSEQDIRITVLTYDPLVRRYVTSYTHFSGDVKGSFRRAGYNQPQDFKFVVSDRWDNHSDTLTQTIHPLQEFEMDKSKFASFPLPPFNNASWNSNTVFSRIFDGRIGNFYYGTTGWMSNDNGPIDFSIDIGIKAKLSRIKMNHPCSPSGNYWYSAFVRYAMREFELYGSNNPNLDGSWDSWDKLANLESLKPGGMSAEELRNYGCVLGEDFFIPGEAGGYRYYRIKVFNMWGGSSQFTGIDELTFYGAEVN
ncbi:DUF4959 domain-containing protein [Sphingobacterium faecale]|uniref:DUF4959 domain-containing protein n=1 Tax=Sphingobacterium faecale TaxID=2803775 RepID=A0ABS1R831_9SPHI|nr:DUF4959 domain-containing protein [Sphingobacterium faecale]MBL1410833.1 DUF4959 domain-containing protein [Sphingobacterium faecale]